MKKNVSIVFPTFNEKGNICKLIKQTNRLFNPDEIIVVDDNSNDGTINVVKNILPTTSNLKLLVNCPVLGLTKSIEKGIGLARNKIVAWMDADFSHPPETLMDLFEKINSHDLVIASWLCKGGMDKRNERSSIFRSIIINNLCRFIFGKSVTAYTSGYAMINKDRFAGYKMKGSYGEYFINLVVWSQRNHLRICEVPFQCLPRKYGFSKTNPNIVSLLNKGLLYLKMITCLWINNKSKK